MNKTTSLQKNYWFTVNEKYNTIVSELKGKVASFQGSYIVRKIKLKDNQAVKSFIQKQLLEKGGVGFEQLYYDPELIDLCGAFGERNASFWLLIDKNEIVGTIGLRTNKESGIGIISKLYFSQGAESHAISLLNIAQSHAKKQGAKFCTIEIEERDRVAVEAVEGLSFNLSKRDSSKMFFTYQF